MIGCFLMPMDSIQGDVNDILNLFIYLPIPVTGPEGPSMSLVLSWELAFYEISVASQKSVMLVFLKWCTFFYSTAFFPLFCYECPYESRVGYRCAD